MNTDYYIFSKNKVQSVIVRCWNYSYLHWHKSCNIKRKFMIFSPVANLMHHPLRRNTYLLTVKLGDKERFDKEQILLYPKSTVTYLRNFCQSRKSKTLVKMRLWKLLKKGDFSNFLDQFWSFTLKRVPKICDPCILWIPFGSKVMIDCKQERCGNVPWLQVRAS
jgi:hypothetical protein